MKNKKVLILDIFLVVVFLIILGIFSYKQFYKNKEEISIKTTEPEEQVEKFDFINKLDGTGTNDERGVNPKIVSVMIDNSLDARPQYGLREAKIVFEALAEGRITRYMAIFDNLQEVDKLGPVRSARPYFVDWARGFGGPLYMHSGGSPDALEILKTLNNNDKIKNADEFRWGGHFWRDNNLYAPHNLFTSSEEWNLLLDRFEDEEIDWEGFSYGDFNASTSTDIKAINISYSPYYEVGWEYNIEENRFLRNINSATSTDALDNQLKADNVVVVYVSMKVIDEIGRREAGTLNKGEATILREGKKISGSWEKTSEESQIVFVDESGNKLNLKPGQTWIQIVDSSSDVRITS